MNFDVVWRSRGVEQPALGSGTLGGVVDDGNGDVDITLMYAEDTNAGEGPWVFGIPVGSVNFMQLNPNGKVVIIDENGQTVFNGLSLLDRIRGEMTLSLEGETTEWSGSYPMQWRAGCQLLISYIRR